MDPVNWHYERSGAAQGPVTEGDFNRLVADGTVTDTTLVWCEGMPAWKPYAEVRPTRTAPPVVPGEATVLPGATPAGSVSCSQCQRLVGMEDVISLGGRPVCAGCKPQVLQMLREGVGGNTQAEQIRKDHIKHEATIKGLALLQILGGVMMLFVALASVVGGVAASASSTGARYWGIALFSVVFYGGLAAVTLWTAIGLRRLRNPARIVAAVFAGLGLLAIPIGTLINGYILWLLLSKKGKMVFSEDYKRIIAETPHVRYRTPAWLWVVVAVLIVAAVVGVVLIVGNS